MTETTANFPCPFCLAQHDSGHAPFGNGAHVPPSLDDARSRLGYARDVSGFVADARRGPRVVGGAAHG